MRPIRRISFEGSPSRRLSPTAAVGLPRSSGPAPRRPPARVRRMSRRDDDGPGRSRRSHERSAPGSPDPAQTDPFRREPSQPPRLSSTQTRGRREMFAVAVETAGAAPQSQQRALADRSCAARILHHQRADDLAVPFLRMFHVEDGVQTEIVPVFARRAQPRRPRSTWPARAGR